MSALGRALSIQLTCLAKGSAAWIMRWEPESIQAALEAHKQLQSSRLHCIV